MTRVATVEASIPPRCVGTDWSVCPESYFGAREDQRECDGFEALDRWMAREEIYDPERDEPPALKSRALSVSHEYQRLLGEDREATSPKCRRGRAW